MARELAGLDRSLGAQPHPRFHSAPAHTGSAGQHLPGFSQAGRPRWHQETVWGTPLPDPAAPSLTPATGARVPRPGRRPLCEDGGLLGDRRGLMDFQGSWQPWEVGTGWTRAGSA